MRIERIEAVQPPTPGSPPDWRTQLGQILVRVTTDEGLEGVGVGGGGLAGVHVIESVLRELLVGRDFDRPEDLHREMCRQTAFYGRKGVVVMAISGVDLALWDLMGKQQGCPVARLLDPQVDLEVPIPTYATVWDEAEALRQIDSGMAAVKLHVERFGSPPDAEGIGVLVERTRQALGAEKEIMLDAFGNWDVESTLAVACQVEPFGVEWIEEPVQPDAIDAYRELMERSPIPIAGGEHEYLEEGFRGIVDRGLHAILQPDINWCGGMTTLIEIYRMAQVAGLRVCPHRGSESYAIHAIAALDPRPLAESPRDWFGCLENAAEIIDGMVRVPDRPGFGLNVDAALWSS
jgi:L-alanine-DL-glutamate epimerase-like enolase superfamily enzyme